jgi:hypothetical protein
VEKSAVRANELLFWLSAKREGTWPQFRAAVEELRPDDDSDVGSSSADGGDFRLHQRLRLDFECLAHAEFFANGCEEGWRVAPPILAAHPVPGGIRAILCGARSMSLAQRLFRGGRDVSYEAVDHPGVPQVIRLVASCESVLSGLATYAGIDFQTDAPLAILSYLDPCETPSRRHPQSELPLGEDWRIREFDTRLVVWRASERRRAQTARNGLFEFQLYDRWRYFLLSEGRTFEVPRAIGVFVVLRRHRGLVRYDIKSGSLSVPGTCRPPRLLERALALCSGFPPSFDSATGRLTYADVPPNIARFAAELLRHHLA